MPDAPIPTPAATIDKDSTASKPATPSVALPAVENPAVNYSPSRERQSSVAQSTISHGSSFAWSALMEDMEASNIAGNVNRDDSDIQPQPDAMGFLAGNGHMDQNDLFAFPGVPMFPDGPVSTSSAPDAIVSSSGAPEPLPASSAVLLPANNDGAFFLANIQPTLHQFATSTQCPDQFSTWPSQEESSRTTYRSVADQNFQMLDFEANFDVGFSPPAQETRQTPRPSTSRHATAPECPSMTAVVSKPQRTATVGHDTWSKFGGCKQVVDTCQASCNCLSTIFDRIGCLRVGKESSSSLPMDRALSMEGNIEDLLAQILRCKSCCRDSTVHLLAFVGVRMVLELLHATAHDEFQSRPRRTNTSWARCNLGRSPARRFSNDGVDRGGNPSLYIGSFKVAPTTRLLFLRRVLRARFHRVAGLVGEQERIMKEMGQDQAVQAANLLLQGILQALRTITGWVELWGANRL